MKLISPTLHGIIDYVMAGVFLVLPSEFAFTGAYAYVCYALAAGYLLVALCTNMPFGLFKWIPFRVHGGVELVSALVFMASPWIFQFSQNAAVRNLFMGLGAAFLVVYALTDWRAQKRTSPDVELR